MAMRTLRISKGGQVSVPAEVRHRWGTSTVEAEDRGHELVLRPAPDDPIEAVLGIFADTPLTADEVRAQMRAEEAERQTRRERPR